MRKNILKKNIKSLLEANFAVKNYLCSIKCLHTEDKEIFDGIFDYLNKLEMLFKKISK